MVGATLKAGAASAKEPAKCIAVNYSPWYAKFPSSDPTIVGPPEDAEMAYYTGLLANVTRWLAASEHPLPIGAFLLDAEKMSASSESPALSALAASPALFACTGGICCGQKVRFCVKIINIIAFLVLVQAYSSAFLVG